MPTRFAASSDVGRKRSHNEDSYRADPGLGLYLVADGMGGHAAGEVASTAAAEAVVQFISATTPDAGDSDQTPAFELDPRLSDLGNRLQAAVMTANRTLSARIRQDAQLTGMATTLSALLVADRQAAVANVGDCRAYLVRDGGIRQVTDDHSWVAEQVRAGLLTRDAAKAHPWRSMVTRALSGATDLAIDTVEFDVEPGDLLVLCSDGLHGVVSDEEMLGVIVQQDGDIDAACRRLVETANERGGPDNITTVIVQVR